MSLPKHHLELLSPARDAAIANLKSSLGLLAQRGAKNVLVSNLPDLGATPEAAFTEPFKPGTVAASIDATNRFNALMPQLLNYGASVGLSVSFLDMAGAVAAVRAIASASQVTMPSTMISSAPRSTHQTMRSVLTPAARMTVSSELEASVPRPTRAPISADMGRIS